jgi:RHS repeat-associated protein
VYVNGLVQRDTDTSGTGLAATGTGYQRLWAVQDASWNVVALVNSSQTVVERYDYDPFGTAAVLTGSYGARSASSYGWEYLFQGGRLDGVTGAYGFEHREMSTSLGRWTTMDPMGFAAGDVDLFRAVANNPVTHQDPNGLFFQVIGPALLLALEGGGAAAAGGGGASLGTGLAVGGLSAVGLGALGANAATGGPPVYTAHQLEAQDGQFVGNLLWNWVFGPSNPQIAPRGQLANQLASASQPAPTSGPGNGGPPQPHIGPKAPPAPPAPPLNSSTQTSTETTQQNNPCFTAGTPIRTPDGFTNIEELRVGDLILSRDEYEPTGDVSAKVVEELFVSEGLVWHLHAGGQVIRTTADHPFFEWSKGWLPCRDLKIGDRLLTETGQWVLVEDLLDTGIWEPLYNLRIADFHTYFVGKHEWGFSVWAHNAKVVKGGVGLPPKGGWKIDTFSEAGVTITGSSASSEPGKTAGQLSAGIPNGQVRISSTEAIEAAGGMVIPTRRSPNNPYHVTITGLTLEQIDGVFGPPIKNPSKP